MRHLNRKNILAGGLYLFLVVCWLLLTFYLTSCAGQGGQAPPRPAPQAAQSYAQPTIQIGGQPITANPAVGSQPSAVATPTLIQERPRLLPATLTPDPQQVAPALTTTDLLNEAQQGVVDAQNLLDECYELQAREFAEGWVVTCLLLEDNLKEANRRLAERMDAALAEQGQ